MFDELKSETLNRRSLLRSAGGFAIGAGALGLLAGCSGDGGNDFNPTPNPVNNDIAVLNFALNLEYLEAEYYLRAIDGTGLSAADSGGTAGTVTGGRAVNFTTDAYAQYAREIANDELAHVRFLRNALGGAAVAKPNINFTDAFNAAAKAAGLGDNFDPFANEVNFLIGAFVFEDVGVTAYKGGAPLLSKTYIEEAAGILGVEAYHAGTIRTLIYQIGGDAVVATSAISDLRNSAGGAGKDQPVIVSGRANIVPTDSNGLAFSRSVAQVTSIVTLGGANSQGGFYPNGLNA
ncbi:ferritin-like domain-containing protein [bacterium]|nr:MAG: ferritin-like domain-containing protein [bacterium]